MAELNNHCFCKTLNRNHLFQILASTPLMKNYLQSKPEHFENLFSSVTVFLKPETFNLMQDLIQAIESALSKEAFLLEVHAHSPSISHQNPGPQGAFCAYDFHIQENHPQLIEINTNAGGLLLNGYLARAQSECCGEVWNNSELEKDILGMIQSEWESQRKEELKTIAIVDDAPEDQFLYLEFLLYQELFERAGFKTIICAPEELSFSEGLLTHKGLVIDFVYNRLTDFYFEDPRIKALRDAWTSESVVVTPNPYIHAHYANKRNLALLSNPAFLNRLNMEAKELQLIRDHIPSTTLMTAENSQDQWQNRKNLFFKPLSGYGSKATYRGDKLTTRVWKEICQASYIAQKIVPPSTRLIDIGGEAIHLKWDLRAYTYRGKIQALAVRLYSGQTTNFRTSGGGFASVAILPKDT